MPDDPKLTLLTDALKFLAQLSASLIGSPRITASYDDRNAVDTSCPSRPQLTATSMSVAVVPDANSYKDSGQRYFFAIEDGVAKVRRPGEAFATIARAGQGAKVVSYHVKRRGQVSAAPAFDMIAAGAGRVLVKEVGVARFYFAMLDPHFYLHPLEPVRSLYFKLDPETGNPAASNEHRREHLAGQLLDHPAAVRIPLFELMMSVDQVDNMAVHVDRHLRVWHRVDMRAPESGVDPPSHLSHVPASTSLVKYQRSDGSSVTKRGIPMYSVLDIGVGHMHWHEQECAIYGGEMDSLDGPGLPPLLMERDVYRFFNGPINDKGGFIDGTANYYVLAQLVPNAVLEQGPRPDAYGILWMDEQAVFSERWRLVHPDDCQFGQFRDVVPSALVQYLAKTPWYHTIAFDRRRFFCPFRAMHIHANSRMAVSRQVIVISGYDPASRRHLLYSINFSFGTADRTWRWRELPPLPRLPAVADRRRDPRSEMIFETIGLREDMTLYLVQQRAGGRTVWFQRYLPADHQHSPDGDALKLPARELVGRGTAAVARLVAELGKSPEVQEVPNAPMPSEGFDHPWQSLPEPVWNEIHSRYSHFGCFQDEVNWRSQYYVVNVNGAAIPANTLDGQKLHDASDELFIEQLCLDWGAINPSVISINTLRGDVEQFVAGIQNAASDLDKRLDDLARRVEDLRKDVEAYWAARLQQIEGLLRDIGSTGRSGVRNRVKAIVAERAIDILRAVPFYKGLPIEAKTFARETLRDIVDNILNADLFDKLWDAIASVADDGAAMLADLKELDLDDDLPGRIRNLVLDRVENAVRNLYGGRNPKLEIAFRFQGTFAGVRIDHRFKLARFDVPVGRLVTAAREAIDGMALLASAVANLANDVASTLQKAAELRYEQVRAVIMGRQLDRYTHPRELRAQLSELVERAVEAKLFVRKTHRQSLFHKRFYLKLLHRPPVGYILVHWDKRDDDLLAFNRLTPQTKNAGIALRLRREDGREFPATIKRFRRVLSPPVVTSAEVRVRRNAAGPTSLSISFSTPLTGESLKENIWRVRLGALPFDGQHFAAAEVILDVLRHERFTVPTRATAHTMTWTLAAESAEMRDKIARYCSAEGRQRHGTSLWFENIVGHVSTPDELTFV